MEKTRKKEPDYLVGMERVRFVTGMSDTTIDRWIKLGLFPKPIKVTEQPNSRRQWWNSAIEKWEKSRK